MTQRQRPSSLDGFIPGSGGRHIGFDRPRGRLTATQRVRIRRPGLHGSTPPRRLTEPPSQLPRPQMMNRAGLSLQHQTGSSALRNQILNDGTAGKPDSQPSGLPPRSRSRFGTMNGGNGANGATSSPRRSALNAKKAGGRRRVSWKKVIKRTALISALFLVTAGGWLGWKVLSNSGKVFGGDSSVLGFLNATKLKGEDKGQVNILLGGVSTDDAGHNGADLTDSIMVVSIDTVNKRATMLSVPRDLWVNIPGYGHSKINAANAYGDGDSYSQPGYPSGGMGLLEQVVSQNMQIPIHYYAKINYQAFRDAVNAVGGISVNIQSSDKRGLYDPNISGAEGGPLKLPNGVQTLDGQTALNLARARGDPPGDGRYPYGFPRSDFDRTEHQRMMLLALKDKITSGGVITNPLKIGQLFDVVGKNMKTDLQPSEIRRMYDLMKQTKSSDIQSISLNDANGVNLLASYTTTDGASALRPAAGVDDFSDIQLYLKKALTNDPVVRESAKVVILNGGDTIGLATKYSNLLTSKGLNITGVGDAPQHQTGASLIIDQTVNNAKPGTRARLQQLFSGSSVKVQSTSGSGYPAADFIIILGDSQPAPSNTSSSTD